MTPHTVLLSLALFSPSGAGAAGLMPTIVMWGGIVAIFYFVLIRPQQKQRTDHEKLVLGIKKGDEVVTVGGIIGEVLNVKETVKEGKSGPTMDDRVTIRSGESKLVVERGRIARVGITRAEPTA